MSNEETRLLLTNILNSGSNTEDILRSLLSTYKTGGFTIVQLLGDLSQIAKDYGEDASKTDNNAQQIFWKQASEKFTELQKWLEEESELLNKEHSD